MSAPTASPANNGSSIAHSASPSASESKLTSAASINSKQSEDMFTKEVSALSLEYLINECIPLSMRVDERLSKKETNFEALISKLNIDENGNEIATDQSQTSAIVNNTDGFKPGRPPAENNESSFTNLNTLDRIEKYGFEIGYKMTDCLIYMKNNTEGGNLKLVDALEIMKFICRDVWKVLYMKQMDNLRTNHIGTFVLIDNSFKPLVHFYSPLGEEDTLKKVEPYLQFPCGLIRGILASLGVDSVVKAEVITKLPAVSFNVQTDVNNSAVTS